MTSTGKTSCRTRGACPGLNPGASSPCHAGLDPASRPFGLARKCGRRLDPGSRCAPRNLAGMTNYDTLCFAKTRSRKATTEKLVHLKARGFHQPPKETLMAKSQVPNESLLFSSRKAQILIFNDQKRLKPHLCPVTRFGVMFLKRSHKNEKGSCTLVSLIPREGTLSTPMRGYSRVIASCCFDCRGKTRFSVYLYK